MMRRIAVGAWLLSSLSAMAEESPNPSQVYIRNITANGSGCPIGSVGSDISPDAKAFTLTFSEYAAEIGPGIPLSESRKNCQLGVAMNIPSGWSYTLLKVDYRGFAALDAGVVGQQRSTYYFQGASGRTNSGALFTNIYGPTSRDFTISDDVEIQDFVWSPCGVTRSLNINTEVRVSGRSGTRGYITQDSIDGELSHTYRIAWRRCS
jgi:hypothetical protein